MTKFKLKPGIGTLAFNGKEYFEGQIFDLPDTELKDIAEYIDRDAKGEATKPKDGANTPPEVAEEIAKKKAEIENMTRDQLLEYIKTDLKPKGIELKGIGVTSSKAEILEALNAL